MKLTMLGTGDAMAMKCYNTCFAMTAGKGYFLVDCGGGNGIIKQLHDARIPLHQIHDIFITHEHPDHLLGIVWMVRAIGTMIKAGKYLGELRIYSHRKLIPVIDTFVKATLQKQIYRHVGQEIQLIPLCSGDHKVILENDVTFFDVGSVKAKQFGFTMRLKDGQKLTCLGDEPYHETVYEYVKDSDWLMHEAFCLYAEADRFKPYEKSHSTVKDACTTAARFEIPNLILYHTEEVNLKHRKKLYGNEGKLYYQGNLLIPDDLEKIALAKKGQDNKKSH